MDKIQALESIQKAIQSITYEMKNIFNEDQRTVWEQRFLDYTNLETSIIMSIQDSLEPVITKNDWTGNAT